MPVYHAAAAIPGAPLRVIQAKTGKQREVLDDGI
jgi:hypothetical protein